jgi:general secretion pathway protein H
MTGAPVTGLPSRFAAGFTLIEILVVVLIMAIALGLIGVNLARSDRDRVRDEADRLVLLLNAAREQAILEGTILAVQFTAQGYQFLQPDARGRLVPIEGDEVLAPRTLPDDVELSAETPGAPTDVSNGLLFDPSGVLPAFTLNLRCGTAVWQALGTADGKIRSQPPEPAHAG